ncbi:MAG: hypothetical protein JWP01_3737 [Myxococcales bacterium]|nr:hypothetical protein [Myxococcales bacterium]
MMREHTALLAALSVGILLGACGHPAPQEPATPTTPAPAPVVAIDAPQEPVALDQDLPRLAERATRLYQEVAQAFVTTGSDCAAATAKLRELQQTYADVIAANAKVLHDGRARQLRVALEPHAAALDASAKAIVDSKTMQACSQDRAFTNSFDELVGAPP